MMNVIKTANRLASDRPEDAYPAPRACSTAVLKEPVLGWRSLRGANKCGKMLGLKPGIGKHGIEWMLER